MNNFEYCMNWVFKSEGGLTDNPFDRGGVTNYGIIQDDMIEAGVKGTPKDLTNQKAKEIFKILYWDNLFLGSVNDKDIALHILDCAVLQGRVRAVRWVQKILNSLDPGVVNDLKPDGIMGMNTLFKINNLRPDNKDRFIDRLVSERKAAFNLTCVLDWKQKIFISGWYNRVNLLP